MKCDKLSVFSCCALLLLLALAPSAQAQTFNFIFTSSGMNATGTVDLLSGVAQSGTISVSGVPVEASPSTLISAAGNLLPGTGVAKNQNGDYLPYDNLVNFANNPILTGNGIDFGSGQYNSDHYNSLIGLWGGDVYGNPSPGLYTLFVGEALLDGSGNVVVPEYVYHSDAGTLTLTAIPEPSAYAAVIGVAILGFVAIRRRKVSA